jgi:hypothetical protein
MKRKGSVVRLFCFVCSNYSFSFASKASLTVLSLSITPPIQVLSLSYDACDTQSEVLSSSQKRLAMIEKPIPKPPIRARVSTPSFPSISQQLQQAPSALKPPHNEAELHTSSIPSDDVKKGPGKGPVAGRVPTPESVPTPEKSPIL